MTLHTIIANYSDHITLLSFPFNLSFDLRFLAEAKHRCFINKYLRNNNFLIAGLVKAARYTAYTNASNIRTSLYFF